MKKISLERLSETRKRDEENSESIVFSFNDRLVIGYLRGGWLEKDMINMLTDGLSETDSIEFFDGKEIGSPYNYYIFDLAIAEKVLGLMKARTKYMEELLGSRDV